MATCSCGKGDLLPSFVTGATVATCMSGKGLSFHHMSKEPWWQPTGVERGLPTIKCHKSHGGRVVSALTVADFNP